MASSRPDPAPPRVAGIGVATGLGYGQAALLDGMWNPRPLGGVLQRPGRQLEGRATPFLGVELAEPPALLPPRVARITSLGGRVAVAVLDEAWRDAGLDALAPERIGLVVGGSNLNPREQGLAREAYAGRMAYLLPSHGYTAFDTDLCGLCTSTFPIRGMSCTLGGASASGLLAVLQAADAVRSGRVDACIALGALQDLSSFELQALANLGALSTSNRCRPFDQAHDGFLFAEACAALVICRADLGLKHYGHILGSAWHSNGQRGPDPSPEGELRLIRSALASAGLDPAQIDYVNTHGTGTPKGDDTEATALAQAGLGQAPINAGKSLIGHGLSAAGTVETAMTLLQMQAGRLHPCQHLENPVQPDLNWVRGAPLNHQPTHALKLSFGFGGMEGALVLGR